jgi:hypothetical protein
MDTLIARTDKKLKRIIEREGTADGERLTPQYRLSLLEDELKADFMRERCLQSHESRQTSGQMRRNAEIE